MIKLFFLMTIAVGLSSRASARTSIETETFTVDHSAQKFISINDWHWTLSESCLPSSAATENLKKENFKCQAATALRSKQKIQVAVTGGQNPGAMVCKALKGQVVYALRNENQITLCRFADGSLASNGSLSYALFR